MMYSELEPGDMLITRRGGAFLVVAIEGRPAARYRIWWFDSTNGLRPGAYSKELVPIDVNYTVIKVKR